MTTPTVADEIDRYLATGGTDFHRSAWSGDSFMARDRQAHNDLRDALVAEVRRRDTGAVRRSLPSAAETIALTRQKSEPMVRGLFPRAEQDRVLALVEQSVVFLAPDTIDAVLREVPWDRSAWDLANLYLNSIDARLLGPDALQIVGLSQETTCYVTFGYFEDEEPFADFVVHEVAHVFHNCRRESAGLSSTLRRKWLLDVDYRKRETFAYSCEAFATVVARARGPVERTVLAETFARDFRTIALDVDPAEVADIVREAATRRNGWKVILARCAPFA